MNRFSLLLISSIAILPVLFSQSTDSAWLQIAHTPNNSDTIHVKNSFLSRYNIVASVDYTAVDDYKKQIDSLLRFIKEYKKLKLLVIYNNADSSGKDHYFLVDSKFAIVETFSTVQLLLSRVEGSYLQYNRLRLSIPD